MKYMRYLLLNLEGVSLFLMLETSGREVALEKKKDKVRVYP